MHLDNRYVILEGQDIVGILFQTVIIVHGLYSVF